MISLAGSPVSAEATCTASRILETNSVICFGAPRTAAVTLSTALLPASFLIKAPKEGASIKRPFSPTSERRCGNRVVLADKVCSEGKGALMPWA